MASERPRGLPWVRIVLAVALLGLAASLFFLQRQARLRGGVLQEGVSPEAVTDFGAVPDFALVSQTGDSLHLDDLRGQVWVADFFFTHCASTCPMMSARFESLAEKIDPEHVRLVSFSVDPERDTPERLAEYANRFDVEPGRWIFLTGDKPQIRALVTDGFHLGIDEPSPEELAQGAEAVLHSTRFVLVDPQGRIRGYYDGNDDEAMEQLGHDVAQLVAGVQP
jgi:cytochrome oxidase Cu insertion factor (SCO1/SenC/PrrC family)